MAMAAWLAAVGVVMAAGSGRWGDKVSVEWLDSPGPNLILEQAFDVTADGTCVVGIGARPGIGGFVPFVWSRTEGLIELPLDVPSDHAGAVRVSGDGRTIYGAMNDEHDDLNIGLIWKTEDFRTYTVETRPGAGLVMGLSGNDLYAAGYRVVNNRYQPFVQNQAAQQIVLPLPVGAEEAMAMDVADDGTVVGTAYIPYGNRDVLRAVVWHPDHTPEYIGPEPIEPMDQSDSSTAAEITPDGRFIAGGSPLGPRWSRDLGWHDPTDFDYYWSKPRPARIRRAFDVSSDGSMIVGEAGGCDYNDRGAGIWQESHGGAELPEWLEVMWGLPDDCMFDITRMSDDGRVIVGTGEGPSGGWRPYIITLPPPCMADANADHRIDGADLSLILSSFDKWVSPGLGPDLNDDGMVNGSDLSILLFNFGDPC